MKKGFTLIELAIVLIIIGLLTGGSFQLLQVMEEKARDTQAKQTLEAAKEAVIAFAIQHNRLPNAGEFTGLGLVGAGNTPIFYNSDNARQLPNGLCNVVATPLNTTDANGINTPNVGFVLAVAGENMNVQTGRIINNIRFYLWNTPNIDDLPAPINRQEPYDDFHTQVTLSDLQTSVECSPFRFVNPSLHSGNASAATYSATLIGEGGSGNYAFTIQNDPQASGMNIAGNVLSRTPPPALGTYSLTIRIRDTVSNESIDKTFALVINP